MGCPRGQDVERPAMLGHLAADLGEIVDAERTDPIGETGEQGLPL